MFHRQRLIFPLLRYFILFLCPLCFPKVPANCFPFWELHSLPHSFPSSETDQGFSKKEIKIRSHSETRWNKFCMLEEWQTLSCLYAFDERYQVYTTVHRANWSVHLPDTPGDDLLILFACGKSISVSRTWLVALIAAEVWQIVGTLHWQLVAEVKKKHSHQHHEGCDGRQDTQELGRDWGEEEEQKKTEFRQRQTNQYRSWRYVTFQSSLLLLKKKYHNGYK